MPVSFRPAAHKLTMLWKKRGQRKSAPGDHWSSSGSYTSEDVKK
eukprot:CAMPEP_0185396140 /NCGR_PEP_ID=MMETSP1364-20130426/84130_1 /TAXON_ID=38817 /ORGANISM="Gephyrocapsa oceanica, Strain RCC1303" /LENGTH=43 /DNA_ID= /DNA_START= /DNA_END= /DNA_ORIENTATION=